MSEFGKGLTYCVGMFLAHAERWSCEKCTPILKAKGVNMRAHWFNGASDHLYEMVIPENYPEELKDRLQNFRDGALEKGHGLKGMMQPNTEEEIGEYLEEAKELLRLIDEEHGIKTEEAEWK